MEILQIPCPNLRAISTHKDEQEFVDKLFLQKKKKVLVVTTSWCCKHSRNISMVGGM
jgi:hypothetical protein